MLQFPLRPLVPLSALALLGWCWYNFRKKSSLCESAKKELLVCSAAINQNILEDAAANRNAQDVKLHCHFQAEDKQEGELDRNCSQPGSTTDDSPALVGASLGTVLTSTPLVQPLKGIRPEPEGEVSKAQASLLLVEKPEMETDDKDDEVKGHSDLNALESFAQQCTGIVCPKEHGVTSVHENQSERVPSVSEADCLVVEVISGATDEITALNGVFKRQGHAEAAMSLQSQVQIQKDLEVKTVSVVTKKDLGVLTVAKGASSAHKSSDRPSGEASDCSTCHSEDIMEAEKTSRKSQAVEKTLSVISVSTKSHQTVAPKNGKLPRTKADASKGYANGVWCANNESSVATNQAGYQSRSRNSPHVQWSIEVPAHLVGRLIGKKGKHISSLKQSSGANIYVSTLCYTYEFQICHLEGSEVQVEKALALVRRKFKDLDLSNRLSSLQPAGVHSQPITSWLPFPQDGTVEIIVPRVESGNYLFVQQHTHFTYLGLCGLTEQMLYCYSHSGCPSLPTPVKAGVLCAAPSPDGAWWRAQVIQHYKDSDIVQIRYVDYGGYVTVNLSSLKQIRSDFVTLPFQASEVMLDNITPLPGKSKFSLEAKVALEELTLGIPLIMKVNSSQNGLPLVHMWRHAGEKMISVNGVLVDRGLCSWLDSH